MLEHFPWPMSVLCTVASVPTHQKEHQHLSAGCASPVCLYQGTATLTVQRLRPALDPKALIVLSKQTRHTMNGRVICLSCTQGKRTVSDA